MNPNARRQITAAAILCGILALAAALPAAADSHGCIPVFRATLIDTPGSYCVTRNISVGSGPLVDVIADDVTLNLNGYTLESTGGGSVIRVGGAAGSPGIVSVRNGAIRGGTNGVEVQAGSPRNVTLENLTVSNTTAEGILVGSAQIVRIRGCTVTGAGTWGMRVLGSLAHLSHVNLSSNDVIDPGHGGISISDPSSVDMIDNEVTDFGAASPGVRGIELINGRGSTRYLMTSSVVTGGTGTGAAIYVGTGYGNGRLFANYAIGNGGDGLWIDSGTPRITEGQLNNNGRNGMIIGGQRAHIEDNTVQNNALYGLTCGGLQDHIYTNNVMRGNTSGPVDPAGCEFSTDAGGNIY